MAKRKRYTDKFRASAVVMLEAAGYPHHEGALTRVANELKMPRQTLQRWATEQQNPAPPELVTVQKKELADLFEDAARIYLAHGTHPDVVDEVPGQASMTAAAIAVDKMQLLRGLPTEIVGMIPDVVKALRKLGQDPADVFNNIIQRAAEETERD